MKNLVLVFDDMEFARLKQKKGSRTWREYILSTVEENRTETAATVPAHETTTPASTEEVAPP